MTSMLKTKSNRANAQASTGPKTADGKARAAQSARRHGLTVPIDSSPMLSQQVELLAKEIAGEKTDREIYEQAGRIAEAQIDLNRIREARRRLLDNPECRTTECPAHDAPPQKVVDLELVKQLVLMGRYEQRALSRRKFAIRAFDLARRQAMRSTPLRRER